jgi:GAF domain-containing protein
VPDVTADPRYVSVRKDIRSELAVPLLVEGALIGVLNVDSKRHDAFSAEDEELLVAIANQSAQVIQNSWLYQAVAHNARQLESLFSVAQSIISSLNLQEILQRVDPGRVPADGHEGLLADAAQSDPRPYLELRACHGAGAEYLQKPPLPVDDSVIGFVIRRRKPLRVDNVQEHDEYRHTEMARKEGLVSLLSVPMLVGDAAIGALNVYTGPRTAIPTRMCGPVRAGEPGRRRHRKRAAAREDRRRGRATAAQRTAQHARVCSPPRLPTRFAIRSR